MSASLWPLIVRLSALLEPAERQAVLGDIAERGASLRALSGLIFLVLLRQLQGWASWRQWMLACAILAPCLFATVSSTQASMIAASGHLYEIPYDFGVVHMRPWTLLGLPCLAWITGYALGSLGGLRSTSVLLLPAALAGWMAVARSHYQPHLDITIPLWINLASCAALAIVPVVWGFLRGCQRSPLRRDYALWIVTLSAPALYDLWYLRNLLPALAILWPVFYQLRLKVRRV